MHVIPEWPASTCCSTQLDWNNHVQDSSRFYLPSWFFRYTTIQNIGVGNILKKHPWLHLFDLNYCKNSNIGEKFIFNNSFEYILKCNLFLRCKAEFSAAITSVSHDPDLLKKIVLLSMIQFTKQLCCLIFLWKLIHFFQDSLMNRWWKNSKPGLMKTCIKVFIFMWSTIYTHIHEIRLELLLMHPCWPKY